MSAGRVALGLGVIRLSVSACGRNMDPSFLEETLRTSVPTAGGERGEEGRGLGEGRNFRK